MKSLLRKVRRFSLSKFANARDWFKLPRYWDACCAWFDGGWASVVKLVKGRIPVARPKPPRRRRSYQPAFESLEDRRVMSAVGFSNAVNYVNENGSYAEISVFVSYPFDSPVTVEYATSNGTAGSSDYTSTSGTLTIGPNGSSQA